MEILTNTISKILRISLYRKIHSQVGDYNNNNHNILDKTQALNPLAAKSQTFLNTSSAGQDAYPDIPHWTHDPIIVDSCHVA